MFKVETIKDGTVSSETHSIIQSMAFSDGYFEDFSHSVVKVGEIWKITVDGHIMINGVVIQFTNDTYETSDAFVNLVINMSTKQVYFRNRVNEYNDKGQINEQIGEAEISVFKKNGNTYDLILNEMKCMDEYMFTERFNEPLQKYTQDIANGTYIFRAIRINQVNLFWFQATRSSTISIDFEVMTSTTFKYKPVVTTYVPLLPNNLLENVRVLELTGNTLTIRQNGTGTMEAITYRASGLFEIEEFKFDGWRL